MNLAESENKHFLKINTKSLKTQALTIYKPLIISIEHAHNYKNKKSIFSLLIKHGYIGVFEKTSDQDDWYKLKN